MPSRCRKSASVSPPIPPPITATSKLSSDQTATTADISSAVGRAFLHGVPCILHCILRIALLKFLRENSHPQTNPGFRNGPPSSRHDSLPALSGGREDGCLRERRVPRVGAESVQRARARRAAPGEDRDRGGAGGPRFDRPVHALAHPAAPRAAAARRE